MAISLHSIVFCTLLIQANGNSIVRKLVMQPDVSSTPHVDTIPSKCVDDPTLDCRYYKYEEICHPDSFYHPWANVHCKAFCGFCATTTTTLPCVDEDSHCAEYNMTKAELCQDRYYMLFREKHCRKYCGLCQPDV